ncbi:hypothetical protein [Polymorphospora lycopeni]|uniref:Uncharacterized protein n=1 Tax=Polymorphospora lycopeni TaxID=3140240 RepID=A0ABV5CPD4_9ACTN
MVDKLRPAQSIARTLDRELAQTRMLAAERLQLVNQLADGFADALAALRSLEQAVASQPNPTAQLTAAAERARWILADKRNGGVAAEGS